MDVLGYSIPIIAIYVGVVIAVAIWSVIIYRHFAGPKTQGGVPATQDAQPDGGATVESNFAPENLENGDGTATISEPNLKNSWLGVLATWRWLKKQRKLAGKGYVQWYLIGDAWPRPKFIKPEDKGGGEFEYEHDGETYLFPKEAMLPTRTNGMWTVVHRKGESKPENLAEPDEFSVSAKQLNDYVTSRVTIDPPGWLSGLSTDPQTLMKYAIYGFIAFVLIQGAMSGGFP
jgi:hypothetical protein